jgi:hypothetical protein
VVSVSNSEKGGLKMIDIDIYFISLKASWVSRLADSKFSNWKLIPLKYLNVFGHFPCIQQEELIPIAWTENAFIC